MIPLITRLHTKEINTTKKKIKNVIPLKTWSIETVRYEENNRPWNALIDQIRIDQMRYVIIEINFLLINPL